MLNNLPPPSICSKPELQLLFLTLCGASHLSLLQQCLYSLYISWEFLPRIQIVSDGTLSLSKLNEALSWWPGSISFTTWEDSILYHQRLGRKYLVEFAEHNVIGRKLAVILQFGEQECTLWCDTDILWFQQIPEITQEFLMSSNQIFKVSEDFQAAYDFKLINRGLSYLCEPPFINTGLVLIHAELYQNYKLEKLLKYAIDSSNHFTEQTILAEVAYRTGFNYWTKTEIECSVDDQLSLSPTYIGKNSIARHYIGPIRHLFWRDALALRLNIRKK
ncbi:MAG: hypothetical protein AAFQ91_02015 [Cyanobacteria bacterium J06621_15]